MKLMVESPTMPAGRFLILPLMTLLLAAKPPGKPAAGVSSMTAEEASAMAREIMPKVEEIRGLKFKQDVPVRVVDDVQARAHFQSRIEKFWPESQIRAEQTAYIQLGLLPAGAELKGSLFALLEEQAAGFYDPDSDTFFVLGDMPRSSAPLLMAHELTHALDDQHYGIDALIEKTRADEERAAGVSAVVEGSGMLVMTLFLSKEMLAGNLDLAAIAELGQSEAGRGDALKAAPPLLQRGLLSPYLLGQTFLLRGDLSNISSGLRAADLDRAFRDPPLSSEQILHPEKYWDDTKRDPPRPVELPDPCAALGAGWSRTGQGDLGEMNIAILTGSVPLDLLSPEATGPGAWTNEAAAGWGGDQWSLCGSAGGRHVTLLATLWDTPEDAAQFESALAPAAGRLVIRRRDAVVLVAGDAGDRAGSLATSVLDSLAPSPSASTR
ncbi:MAG TPA: hypothetical protein VGK94_04750 [Candidatus Polarisedimenticolia bacterium]|jgi:hypothetical protein